ncbi:hypothetical protein ACFL28_03420 [Candidatus Omnitrophota bacterium]
MCYVAPVIGAVISSVAWNKTKNVKVWWLTLLFCGGALFGVIDHLWNGELFLISENIGSDLLLGVAIVAVILVTWVATVAWSKKNSVLATYIDIKS